MEHLHGKEPISSEPTFSTNFTTLPILENSTCTDFIPIAKKNRTSGNRTSGGPHVLVCELQFFGTLHFLVLLLSCQLGLSPNNNLVKFLINFDQTYKKNSLTAI